MSPRAKFNVVLICMFVPAVAAVVLGIQSVIIAYAGKPLPPLLIPLVIIMVLATIALSMWSTVLRRDLPPRHH